MHHLSDSTYSLNNCDSESIFIVDDQSPLPAVLSDSQHNILRSSSSHSNTLELLDERDAEPCYHLPLCCQPSADNHQLHLLNAYELSPGCCSTSNCSLAIDSSKQFSAHFSTHTNSKFQQLQPLMTSSSENFSSSSTALNQSSSANIAAGDGGGGACTGAGSGNGGGGAGHLMHVADVYNTAAEIGRDFETLIDRFGTDSISSLMPKVIGILEELEEFANRYEVERNDVRTLQQNVTKLELDKASRIADRMRFEQEMEQLEENWRAESRQMAAVVNRLKRDNAELRERRGSITPRLHHQDVSSQKEANNANDNNNNGEEIDKQPKNQHEKQLGEEGDLAYKEYLHNQRMYEERQLLLKLKSIIDRQMTEKRKLRQEMTMLDVERESLDEQNVELGEQLANLRRLHCIGRKPLNQLEEEKADLQLQIATKQRLIDQMRGLVVLPSQTCTVNQVAARSAAGSGDDSVSADDASVSSSHSKSNVDKNVSSANSDTATLRPVKSRLTSSNEAEQLISQSNHHITGSHDQMRDDQEFSRTIKGDGAITPTISGRNRKLVNIDNDDDAIAAVASLASPSADLLIEKLNSEVEMLTQTDHSPFHSAKFFRDELKKVLIEKHRMRAALYDLNQQIDVFVEANMDNAPVHGPINKEPEDKISSPRLASASALAFSNNSTQKSVKRFFDSILEKLNN